LSGNSTELRKMEVGGIEGVSMARGVREVVEVLVRSGQKVGT
jgi:hypothetical protein